MTEHVAELVQEPKQKYAMTLAEVEREDPTMALSLRASFDKFFDELEVLAARAMTINVTSEDQKREMKAARDTRLALKDIRVRAEHARKKVKEGIVRQGKAIDGFANIIKALVEPLEEKLLEDEKFAERAEQARKDALGAARAEALLALGADPTQYVNLGEMTEETWASTLETAKLANEQRIAKQKEEEQIRLEAERIAAERAENERKEAAKREAERVAREEEQKAENERLRQENAAKERQAAADREKHEAEKRELEAQAARDREAAAAREKQIAEEKQKAEADAAAARKVLADAEREASEKLEREKKAKAEEERRKAEEAERAELAPDKEKLMQLAAELRQYAFPSFTTKKGKDAGKRAKDNFAKLAEWLEKTAGEL